MITMSARARWSAAALVGTAILVGCSAPTGAPEPTVVQLQADFPVYDTDGLVDEATLVVEGEAVSVSNTVVTPRFEGDDPRENPLAGLSEEEQQEAIEDAEGVPATLVTFRVEVVHSGEVVPGDEVTIMQTGGVVSGVSYEVAGETILVPGERYLIFAMDSFDGAYAIVGGSAGTYLESAGSDEFVAADPDVAPEAGLTSDQVAELTD